MTQPMPADGLQLRSRVGRDGQLDLFLEEVPIPALRPDQVLIRVEAVPINPSDLMLMLAGADPALARRSGPRERPRVAIPLPAEATARHAARLDLALTPGNEGAGVVVAAGAEAQSLLGRTVAAAVGGMYAQYRVVKAARCLVLPEGVTPEEGAAAIINPTTVLGMVGTMRLEGHRALVHTAAASSLGQMLGRVCLDEGVPLVNVVRRPEQAALLREQGARQVCDSSQPDFDAALAAAVAETGATIAFDAIGGGTMAGRLLAAMEAAVQAGAPSYLRYGSEVLKQVYVYGALDPGPTILSRDYGWTWSLAGWSIPPFLARIGPAAAEALNARIIAELRTTFATRFGPRISLHDLLDPQVMAGYAALATGDKHLILPHAP